jgi:hypothetical protein
MIIKINMAKATQISIQKVGIIVLGVLGFLLIAYTFTPTNIIKKKTTKECRVPLHNLQT